MTFSGKHQTVQHQTVRPRGAGFFENVIGVPLELNCTEVEETALRRFFRDFGMRQAHPGLRFTGSRMEGPLMAMACWATGNGYDVRVVTVAEVSDLLAQGKMDALLASKYLFILDLEVWPAVFGCEAELTEGLMFALYKRSERQLPTIICLGDTRGFGEVPDWWFKVWLRSSEFTVGPC